MLYRGNDTSICPSDGKEDIGDISKQLKKKKWILKLSKTKIRKQVGGSLINYNSYHVGRIHRTFNNWKNLWFFTSFRISFRRSFSSLLKAISGKTSMH